VAVCDAFDALVNDRPYRVRKSLDDALTTLRAGRGRQWDPDVVDAFLMEVPRPASLGAA
jgi:HD-GYP domain-containing protein (c-di-GMP phosphodiesterase class II)